MTVALVGAEGHGLWHRRVLHRLATAGRIEVVGLCDRRPVVATPDAPVDQATVFTDHQAMLAATRPDVVAVCTPPHTHLSIALDALAAGADLLLEKPPVTTLTEHRRLAAALHQRGRICQVGFQALGSAALDQLTGAIRAGELGKVGSIGALGAWWRPDSYYRRAPWAGRSTVDGRLVGDGALVNPFAHALMQSLALAEVTDEARPPVRVELERYRSRPIEVDDVTFLRVTYSGGLQLIAAVALASGEFIAGEVTVAGSAGQAVLEYPTDRLQLPGDDALRQVPGRVGLLENLLDHRADRGVPLIASLSATARFTMLAEAVMTAPAPSAIDRRYLRTHPEGGGHTVDGITEILRTSVDQLRLPSELSVPWAVRPFRAVLDRRE